VRKLAVELGVHPNTVAGAFQELEHLGVIAACRGIGMEVTLDALKICQPQRRRRVSERIPEVFREAISSGLSAEELGQLVEDEISRGRRKRRE
jgi:DNA-binding transcriptional regulator YhcF (GntR family)